MGEAWKGIGCKLSQRQITQWTSADYLTKLTKVFSSRFRTEFRETPKFRFLGLGCTNLGIYIQKKQTSRAVYVPTAIKVR